MPIFQGTYTITNQKSQTRVDLDNGNSANGTKVQGYRSFGPDNLTYYPNQVWKVQYTNKLGVDSYTISNVRTGTYIELSDGTDGTQVTCSAAAAGSDTSDNQEWEFIKVDNSGYYKVRNVKFQTYLDIDSGSSADGTKIQAWWGLLDGNENQLWAFNKVDFPPA
ncbi:Ricin-type beta-trefoil lectin domain-containing protein [Mycena sanguinolenta]|uniref:Ricin-type beta-trefoil lectin domain-containing protein n=1 Tax=Mycena sanguinolenta TaxID=230812 RepID=A0A8H6Z5C6_9AGAR|nr:Ricin-type beta-trefoil lectin domain-containing protein [Mycena sanguinolenta]